MENLFVYGTFKPGFYNFDAFKDCRVKIVEDDVELLDYAIKVYSPGPKYYNYPFAFYKRNATTFGTLLLVDDEALSIITATEVAAGYVPAYGNILRGGGIDDTAMFFRAGDFPQYRKRIDDDSIPIINYFDKEHLLP